MKYTMVRNIVEGMKGEVVALPVIKNNGKKLPDETRPYTAFEVLTDFYGEDMNQILGGYVSMELETIQKHGALQEASSARLLLF